MNKTRNAAARSRRQKAELPRGGLVELVRFCPPGLVRVSCSMENGSLRPEAEGARWSEAGKMERGFIRMCNNVDRAKAVQMCAIDCIVT